MVNPYGGQCLDHEAAMAPAWRDAFPMVGLPGFEPGSIAPKATSIDQTNPQARRARALVRQS